MIRYFLVGGSAASSPERVVVLGQTLLQQLLLVEDGWVWEESSI
jgi:hypothetical protein